MILPTMDIGRTVSGTFKEGKNEELEEDSGSDAYGWTLGVGCV